MGSQASHGSPAGFTRTRLSLVWVAGYVVLVLLGTSIAAVFVAVRVAELRDSSAGSEDVRVHVLERAVDQSPKDLVVRRQLAYAYQQTGRDGDALREYGAVLDVEPDDLASLYNSGLIQLASGDEQEGERSMLRVLKLAPTHSLAAAALGTYYADEGNYDRLLDVVLPAADAHPDAGDLQYLAGRGYENAGDKARALERFKLALELVPQMNEARTAMKRLARQ